MPVITIEQDLGLDALERRLKVLDGATVEEVEGLAPLHDPAAWAERLDGADDGIVLVGNCSARSTTVESR